MKYALTHNIRIHESHRLKDVFIFLAPFASAIFSNIYFGFNRYLNADSFEYLDQAQLLIQNFEFIRNSSDEFLKPPGVPILLAFLHILFEGNWIISYKLLMCMLHGLTVLLAFKICGTLNLSRFSKYIAVGFISLDPLLLISTTEISTEPIASAAIIAWLYWALRIQQKQELSTFFRTIFICLSTLCIASRPNYILIFVCILCLLVFYCGFESTIKKVELIIIMGLIILLVAFTSWLHNGFVFLAPYSGLMFYFLCKDYLIPSSLGFVNIKQNEFINERVLLELGYLKRNFFDLYPSATLFDFDQELKMLGIRQCFRDGGNAIFSIMSRIIGTWRPFLSPGGYSLFEFFISLFVLSLLTLAGIIFIVKTHEKEHKFFRHLVIWSIVIFTVSVIPTPSQIRHRIAFSEVFLWIIFALVIDRIRVKRKLRNIQSF